MTESENKALAYPEYDESGAQNPIRVPITAESEQWEKEAELAIEEMEQSGNPGYSGK